MKTRVIVCGGRDFSNKNLCYESLEKILKGRENLEIVSGHAKGADTYGEDYARDKGISISIFKPDWKHYGRGAGPIRNRQMLEYALKEQPIIIAFWDGKSKGTKNMIEQGRAANAEVFVVKY